MADVTKVTFTLDDDTVATIREIAERRRKPQSLIVREAVAAYAAQEEKLDDGERTRRLRVLDDLAAEPQTRRQADVDQELRQIRVGRRVGWRRPSD
jgi:O6-methylguanine-DNA--protein-cysteine methyltransferase